jgi:Mn-dependent DtxR family transcriptional regulator
LTRKLRQEIFNPELFGEPAWDIMLILFSDTDHSGQISVQEIALELNLTEQFISRWIFVLAKNDLVVLCGDRAELSANGRNKLKNYLKRQIASLTQLLESNSPIELISREAS